MKKLTKILIIVLSVALLCGAFVLGASANDDAPEATTHISFVVYDAEGKVVTTNATEGKTEDEDTVVGYVKLSDAFANVPSNGTVRLVSDYEDGPNTDTTVLNADKQNVTLDLNGNTLSASYSAKMNGNTEGYSWQKISVYGSLKVTGKGSIETATSAFIVNAGASLTFDAGEGNTIYLVAKPGYNKDTGALSANKMPGIQFIKIGSNSAVNANATVTVKGNLSFEDQSDKGSNALFGLSGGVTLNIEDANIDSTIPGINAAFAENFFSGTYDKETYVGPQINISNSKITSPYGIFLDGANKATDYSDAIALTVNNSVLDLVGDNYPASDGAWKNGDITAKDNNPVKVVMNNTTVRTDNNFFYGKQANEVPNATVQLNGCEIDIATVSVTKDGEAIAFGNEWNYIRLFFHGTVTAKVNDTVLYHASSRVNGVFVKYTHAWGTKAQAVAAGYTDPGYFEELGMGVLFGSGTAIVNGRSDGLQTSGAACAYSEVYAGYTVESGKSLLVDQLVWANGVAGKGKVVASGEGGKILRNFNFEDAVVGTNNAGNALSDGGSYGSGLDTASILTRNGKYTVCQYAENNYVTHVAREGNHQHKTDPFISLGFDAGSAGNYSAAIDTARFYSFDVDMAKAAINHSRGDFTIAILFRPIIKYVNVLLSTDANGNSVWKIGSKTLTDAPVAAAGVWQHVQVIIEAPVINGAFDKNGDFNIYLYLDGKLAGSATLAEANAEIADSIKSATDLKTVAITEVRYKFPSTYRADDTGSTAFDNLLLSRYPVAYTGDLASVVTTKNKLPENLPVAKVGNNYYSNVEDAFVAAGKAANANRPAELEYLMDLSSFSFDVEKYIVRTNAKVRITSLGGVPTVNLGAGYVMDNEGNGKYLLRPATDADKVTVNWYGADGKLVDTNMVMAGRPFAVIPTNTEDVVKDYYTVVYKWAIDDKVIESDTTTVMGDTDIYLVPTFKATFDDLYINAKLLDNLTLQLFLPKDFIDASSRIEKVGDKDTQVGYAIKVGTNNANTQADMFTIGGKVYNSFVKYSNYAAITTEWTIEIEYTVEFNGKDYKLSREFEATSILEYCEYILTAVDEEEKPVYSELEKNHVANLIRFANEYTMISTANHAYNAVLDAAYEKYKSYCTADNKELLTGTPETDITNLQAYIKDIGFEYNNGRIRYVVTFKDDSKVTGVQFLNVSGSPLMTYSPDNMMADGQQQNKTSNPYYSIYRTASNRIFTGNFFGKLTIKLTVEDVGVVEGTYDLKTWYNGALETEEEKEMWAKVLNSLYSLSHTLGKYWNEEIPKE